MRNFPFLYIGLFFAIFFIANFPATIFATDYTSSSFIVRDPVIAPTGAGYSSSGSFQYFSSIGQVVTGESSVGGFIERSGFLYFSAVTTPVLTATSGDQEVSLSWTAATATLGYNVTAYEVGISTTSGSGYSYTNVGNTLSYTATGLINGTSYYFVVRALDIFGDPISTSGESSATPATSGGGGGGGGGGGSGSVVSGLHLTGYAYPLSTVTILQDGVIVAETIAGGDARFSVRLNDLPSGNYNFGVYATDENGLRSLLFSFPIMINEDDSIDVSGIFIAPSIDVDKSQVKQGDDLVIFGQTTPESDVTIQVNSLVPHFVTTNSDDNGVYLNNFNTAILEMGNHDTKSKTLLDNGQSSGYGDEVAFVVGTENIPKVPGDGLCHADLNSDDHVNLVDFSVAAFWYKKTLSADMVAKESSCLNGDKLINLTDFSIMAYYWTG